MHAVLGNYWHPVSPQSTSPAVRYDVVGFRVVSLSASPNTHHISSLCFLCLPAIKKLLGRFRIDLKPAPFFPCRVYKYRGSKQGYEHQGVSVMQKGKIRLLIEPDQIGIPEAYIIDQLNEKKHQQEYGYTMPAQMYDTELNENNSLDVNDYQSVIVIDL
jgi:hypothetical protein